MTDSELMGCTEEVDGHDIESTSLTEAVSLGESIEASEDIQGTALQVSHVGTVTDSEIVGVSPFRIEQMKDDDQAIKFYTGFPHVLTF